jgi:hypothetical protein
MGIRWRGPQPQILDGFADGEVIQALPIMPLQTECPVQLVIEITANPCPSYSSGLGGQIE